jgi:NAD(P)-dependent dehydrogenase (short-subunit alcohol dehydrogenase family)
MTRSAASLFDLSGRVFVITGGAGFLGQSHAAAIAEAGGVPVLVDLAPTLPERIEGSLGFRPDYVQADITREQDVEALGRTILDRYGHVDGLINNAANNPKMEDANRSGGTPSFSRLEHYRLADWASDLAVGLTGAFLCSRVLGAEMARRGRGVIVNIASDLALIGPDQRIYRDPTLPQDRQPTKPVSYSVVKTGLIGLTRYLATYWASSGVRVNALSPGGIENGQPEEFVTRLSNLIPMGRMAGRDEYQGAILFLCSDASTYMTGTNLVVDGGRTAW